MYDVSYDDFHNFIFTIIFRVIENNKVFKAILTFLEVLKLAFYNGFLSKWNRNV